MARYVIVGLVVLILLGAIGWEHYQQNAAEQREQARIAEMNEQIRKLREENAQLKASLEKVQSEETRLVTANDLLTKTIEQAKVTGKMPEKIPYPPK
jgi:predicted negative regulator of RcsB-dependent stress response